MSKTFVQFAHGLLVDVENFARHHAPALPSFNPAPEELTPPTLEPVNVAPVAHVADAPVITTVTVIGEATESAEHTPAPDGNAAHTPAPETTAPVAPVSSDPAPVVDENPDAKAPEAE